MKLYRQLRLEVKVLDLVSQMTFLECVIGKSDLVILITSYIYMRECVEYIYTGVV